MYAVPHISNIFIALVFLINHLSKEFNTSQTFKSKIKGSFLVLPRQLFLNFPKPLKTEM